MTGGTQTVVGVVVGTVGGVVVPGAVTTVVPGTRGTVVEGAPVDEEPVKEGLPAVGRDVVVVPESAASAAFSRAIVAARRCCSAVKVVVGLVVATVVDGVVVVEAGATWAPTQLSATAVTPTQPSSEADAALLGVVIGLPRRRHRHCCPSCHCRSFLRRRHRSMWVRWSKW